MYISMGNMNSYNKVNGWGQPYVTILNPYPEFELCTIDYEPPECILCVYVRYT